MANLEHVNVTVSDPKTTAAWLLDVFDWTIRWQGPTPNGGYSVHIGADDSYIALYRPNIEMTGQQHPYATMSGLNHIGVCVDNIHSTEQRVKQAGFTPEKHGDYEPGLRFYFADDDGVEWEVVSYTTPSRSNDATTVPT